MVYVIQLANRIRTEPGFRPDDGQRNCPKHVEFYSKNKFEKLVHLVGFIIRIYHYARSPERQISIINIALFWGLSVYSLVDSYLHFGEISIFRVVYRE